MRIPEPPAPPTAAEISNQIAQSKALATVAGSAVEVAVAGYTLVDDQCNIFFSSVQKWSNGANLARKETTLVGAAAAGVLAAIHATATSIALTAIAFGLTADSIDNFQNFALFSPKPDTVYKLVLDAMAAYREAAPPEDPNTYGNSVSQAQRFVSGYASLCTYARIQQLIDQAVSKAVPVDNGKDSGFFTTAEKMILVEVNKKLGLPAEPLLTDLAYTQLDWYLTSLYKDAARRDAFLDQHFSNLKPVLIPNPGTSTLRPNAQDAADLLAKITQINPAFAKAVTALADANPAPPGGFLAAPGGPAQAFPFVIPPAAVRTRNIPNITIR